MNQGKQVISQIITFLPAHIFIEVYAIYKEINWLNILPVGSRWILYHEPGHINFDYMATLPSLLIPKTLKIKIIFN